MTRSFWRRFRTPVLWLSIATLGLVVGRRMYVARPSYDLPYAAQFDANAQDNWTAWGGGWEVGDGAMRNDSNDRGAKIVTGSPNWRNYIVEGDVQLLGQGSVGMLGRVSGEELGENAFRGYLAGVRTADHSLFLGEYDFFYREAARVEMPEPVRPYRWYHIRLEMDGCRLTASAWAVGTPEVQTRSLESQDCFRSGRIGLRTNGTGGVWRNVKAYSLDSAPPLGEDVTLHELDPASFQGSALPRDEPLATSFESTRSLQYLSPVTSPVAAIRGSVVLTRPAVYVQDSTGSVQVRFDGPTSLKIGDEVEVAGEVNLDGFSPVIQEAKFRLIRQGTPEGPEAVAAHHLADGAFDGQFVEVEGVLRTIATEADGSVSLRLDAGAQSFRAIMPAGRSASHVGGIAIGSQLRLTGVTVVDPQFNRLADPFVILTRSAEGVAVLAGPPFWRPTTFVFVGLVGLILIFVCNHFYLLIKHWRLHALAEERERLAHQIHDTLAQSFAGIGFQLQAIRNSLPAGEESLSNQVELAMSMARTSHEEAHRCIASLRPEPLGPISIVPALRDYAELIVQNGNVKVETSGEVNGRTVPRRVREAFFGIGKEAITNSIRHAAPHTIRIRLQRQREVLCLSVEDDGDGFQSAGNSAGFGLVGMQRRANSISATLTVKSTIGRGTRVEVQAPVGTHLPRPTWINRRNWSQNYE